MTHRTLRFAPAPAVRTVCAPSLRDRGFGPGVAIGLGLALTLALTAPAGAADRDGGPSPDSILVTFASTAGSGTPDACEAALTALAIGHPVSFADVDCLRTFVLAPATPAAAAPQATPEACEAMLPDLATGRAVPLGTAVPCVESYVAVAPPQVAAR